MGGVKQGAFLLLLGVLAIAGCKNAVVDVIGQQYDSAGGFDPTFVISNDTPLVNGAVTFTNATLAQVKSIHWDFGDGATADNVTVPNHAYAAKGAYTVTMTATSTHGTVRSVKAQVVAQGTDPTITVSLPTGSSFVGNAAAGTGHVAISVTVWDKYGPTTPGLQSFTIKVNGTPVDTPTIGSTDTSNSTKVVGYQHTYQWDSSSVVDGAATIRIEAVDGDSQLSSVDVPVTVDNTPPVLSTVTVGSGGFTATASVNVATVANDGTGSGLAQMAFSNDGVSGFNWEPYSATRIGWMLSPATEGSHTVYAKVRDGAGNESTIKNGTISLDSQPPQVSSFTIAQAPATKLTSVTLNVTATDAGSSVDWMQFSNDNSTWSGWETYTTSRANWPLNAGADGPKIVYAQFKDHNGHVTSATISASVTLDRVAPAISSTSFSSAGWLKANSTVSLNITTSPAETALSGDTITINGVVPTSFTNMGGGVFVAVYTVGGGDTNRALNAVPISVVLTDQAGNSNTAYTTAPVATPGVDTIAPSITTTSFTNTGWLKAGSTVVLNITAGASEAGLTAGPITVNGKAVTGFTDHANGTYSVTYTVAGGDTNRAQNAVPISVVLTDQAGNSNTAYVSAPASTPGVDTLAPAITSTSFSNTGWLKAGSTVTLNITTGASETGLTAGAITVNGKATTNFGGSGTAYHADYTVAGGDTNEAALNQMPISVVLTDQAGNSNTAYTTHPASTPAVDTVAPTVISASFGTTGWLKAGSTVTLNITTGSSETGLAPGIITVNTMPTTNFGGSATAWHADYHVSGGDPNQSAFNQMPISVVVTDQAGNSSTAFTLTPALTPAVDTVAPVIVSAVLLPASGWAGVGFPINLQVDTNGDPSGGLTASAISVNGRPVTGFTDLLNGSYTMMYTVTGGDTNRPQNFIPISVVLADHAGNTNAPFTAVTGGTPGVDTVPPGFASVVVDVTKLNITATFTEGVYEDPGASMTLQPDSVTIKDLTNGKNAAIMSVTQTLGNPAPIYVVSWPQGAPSTGDSIRVTTVASKIYDIAGNPVPGGTVQTGPSP
jgi:large repetitive protein